MGSSRTYRRAGTAVLAGLLMGAVLGLTACDGGGEIPSSLPSGRSSERSFERPASDEPEATRSPEAERTTERAESTPSPTPTATTRTQPARTTRPAETTTRPAATDTTTAAVPAATTTRPATTDTTTAAEPTRTTVTPAASPSAAAAAESQDWWPLGWLLLVALLVALVVGGLFVYRSQRRSGWDSEVRALESETRTVTATRLPPVLTTTTTSQRGLVWPPVRMALGDLVSRWDALTERASGEDRRN